MISGTPTAVAWNHQPDLPVTDSGTPTALTSSVTLNLTINAAPAIAFTGMVPATATYNMAYTGSAAATGGAGALTYSVFSGALPTGLTLNPASGAITGLPTVTGTFNFVIKAADGFGDSLTQSYSIVVSYSAVVVTPATLPTGYMGSVYHQSTLTATGGSGTGYSFALANGTLLPAGLNLSLGGVITGTPTATGTTNFTVTATDSASNTGNGNFSITVNAGVSITTGLTLPTGYVGSNYSQTLAATGGSGTGYTWAVTNGSTLPARAEPFDGRRAERQADNDRNSQLQHHGNGLGWQHRERDILDDRRGRGEHSSSDDSGGLSGNKLPGDDSYGIGRHEHRLHVELGCGRRIDAAGGPESWFGNRRDYRNAKQRNLGERCIERGGDGDRLGWQPGYYDNLGDD